MACQKTTCYYTPAGVGSIGYLPPFQGKEAYYAVESTGVKERAKYILLRDITLERPEGPITIMPKVLDSAVEVENYIITSINKALDDYKANNYTKTTTENCTLVASGSQPEWTETVEVCYATDGGVVQVKQHIVRGVDNAVRLERWVVKDSTDIAYEIGSISSSAPTGEIVECFCGC